MNGGKKDLTRIEDLSEYLHELEDSSEDESTDDISFSDDASELPTIPEDEEESSDFTSSFESDSESVSGSDFTMPNWDSEEPNNGPQTDSFANVDDGPFAFEENSTESFSSPEFEPQDENENENEEDEDDLFSPAPTVTIPEREYIAPENFSDLKTFSENSSFSTTATEANPSFSVLLKDIRYIEDVNDILSLLKEFNLLNSSEEQTKERLMRGSYLVPRISEYLAILLAHKLRRFDIDIQVGLSDEIHPPKHQEKPELGIVSKQNLYQNQGHHFQFEDVKLDISQIIVAATPSLEGYHVLRYLGVASEHQVVDAEVIMDEESAEVPKYYQELAQRLKAHALKARGNAIVGLNYQLTPLPNEFGIGSNKYRLTCTGNIVWVNKI